MSQTWSLFRVVHAAHLPLGDVATACTGESSPGQDRIEGGESDHGSNGSSVSRPESGDIAQEAQAAACSRGVLAPTHQCRTTPSSWPVRTVNPFAPKTIEVTGDGMSSVTV
jgi:hypothetical protein